jgi:hypothetical protein
MPPGGHSGAGVQLEEPDLQMTRRTPIVDQDGVPEPGTVAESAHSRSAARAIRYVMPSR